MYVANGKAVSGISPEDGFSILFKMLTFKSETNLESCHPEFISCLMLSLFDHIIQSVSKLGQKFRVMMRQIICISLRVALLFFHPLGNPQNPCICR